MANKEIVFTDILNDPCSNRELHFSVDERNRVQWWIIPYGEQGISVTFKSTENAERFAQSYARRLGFTRRIAQVSLEKMSV